MKKLFLLITTVLVLLTTPILYCLFFIDFEALYENFVQNSTNNNEKFTIIDARMVPALVPYAIIKQLKQGSQLELENIKIKFSIASILRFDPKIEQVTADSAKLTMPLAKVSITNHQEFIKEVLNNNLLSFDLKIYNLICQDAAQTPLLKLNYVELAHDDDNAELTGRLIDDTIINLNIAKQEDRQLIKLTAQNKQYNAELHETYQNGVIIEGGGTLKIKSLAASLISYLPGFEILAPKVATDQEAIVKFALKAETDRLEIQQIDIQGPEISGSGEVIIDVLQGNKLNFAINKLDLQGKASKEQQYDFYHLKQLLNNGQLANNKLSIDLNIQNIALPTGNSIDNLRFKARGDNLTATIQRDSQQFLHIEQFDGQIQAANMVDSGSFNITGDLIKLPFRYVLAGNINLTHPDINAFTGLLQTDQQLVSSDKKPLPFVFNSKVKFSSVDLLLQDFSLTTPENKIQGYVSTKFIGNTPRVNANIQINKLDLDNTQLQFIRSLQQYGKYLTENMHEEQYLNKFAAWRALNLISHYNISIGHLTLYQEQFNNMHFDIALTPELLNVEQIHFEDQFNNWLDLSLYLQLNNVKPALNIVVHNGSVLNSQTAQKIDWRQILTEQYDLSKIDIGLQLFLQNWQYQNIAVENLFFTASNKQYLINIDKLQAKIFGGSLQGSGSVLLKPYTVNFVYGLSSAQISALADLLPKGFITTEGFISASGMCSTEGETLQEQVYNFYTKSNIVTKDIVIDKLAIDELITKLNSADYNILSLPDDIKIAMLTGQTKVSDLKASIELSKGVFQLPSVVFKTKYASGAGAVEFNLYDMQMKASSMFSFYLASLKQAKNTGENYEPVKLRVQAQGNWYNPKKTPITDDLEKALKARVK